MPMAASSAMMAAITSAGVSPGMAIMSRPTEQTAVIASSFSIESAPQRAASIMPASSETGMNAPDSPPTDEEAMTPPFLTASFKRARAAVVPQPPHFSMPISSMMCATESPTAGVGARERSTMPNGTPSRRLASVPMSWPMRGSLKAVFLMSSATPVMSRSSGAAASAARTTPGPETPTLMTQSGSPAPWKAPAMKGLSSGALQKTTSFAAAKQLLSAVISAQRRTTRPIIRTASRLMPVLVEPMLTDEQTWSVRLSASGMALISASSPAAKPLWTRAEKPPMKLTPTSQAARSRASAYCTGSPPLAAASMAMGVTEMRLLMMGTPYSISSASPVLTRSRAQRVIFW